MAKPIDSWWTVIVVDPIAVPLTGTIARWPRVTPVMVSALAHVLGLATVALFATGHFVAGAITFEVRFVLDCVDGKLARATERTTNVGRELDVRGDQLITVLVIVSLGLRSGFDATALLAGVHPLSMLFLETRNRLAASVAPPTSERLPVGRWRASMARRRLYPVPTSVDVEHLAFFIAPLLSSRLDAVLASLWVATSWFGLQLLRYAVEILSLAHRIDHRTSSAAMADEE